MNNLELPVGLDEIKTLVSLIEVFPRNDGKKNLIKKYVGQKKGSEKVE